jgi:hypothetical protein
MCLLRRLWREDAQRANPKSAGAHGCLRCRRYARILLRRPPAADDVDAGSCAVSVVSVRHRRARQPICAGSLRRVLRHGLYGIHTEARAPGTFVLLQLVQSRDGCGSSRAVDSDHLHDGLRVPRGILHGRARGRDDPFGRCAFRSLSRGDRPAAEGRVLCARVRSVRCAGDICAPLEGAVTLLLHLVLTSAARKRLAETALVYEPRLATSAATPVTVTSTAANRGRLHRSSPKATATGTESRGASDERVAPTARSVCDRP